MNVAELQQTKRLWRSTTKKRLSGLGKKGTARNAIPA